MVDILTTLFGTNAVSFLFSFDFLSIIIGMLACGGLFLIARHHQRKIPIFLFIPTFILILNFFVASGLANPIYAVALIFGVGILAVQFFGKTVLKETYTGETKILLNYTVFIGVTLILLNISGLNGLSGTLPVSNSANICTFQGDWLTAIANFLGCASSYISTFIQTVNFYFNFSTPIGIINTVFFVPFLIFLGVFIINHIPTVSGGK